MIYRDIISRPPWEIEISNHAFEQALLRDVNSFLIESAIRCGRMEWFGKNYVRFVFECSGGRLICLGEKKTRNFIKILIIEWG